MTTIRSTAGSMLLALAACGAGDALAPAPSDAQKLLADRDATITTQSAKIADFERRIAEMEALMERLSTRLDAAEGRDRDQSDRLNAMHNLSRCFADLQPTADNVHHEFVTHVEARLCGDRGLR